MANNNNAIWRRRTEVLHFNRLAIGTALAMSATSSLATAGWVQQLQAIA
jgi:hypothetical protein